MEDTKMGHSFLPKTIWILLIIAGVGLIGMIVEYPIHFRRISSDPAIWGQFGDYFGLVVNIANTIGVFVLSYAVYRSQIDRDRWERRYMAMQEQPLLRFVSDRGKTYRLYNMGKGPAHKVIIGKVTGKNASIDLPPYKAYSIPANAYINVDWATNAGILYALYEGEQGVKYMVKCQGDVNDDLQDDTEEEKQLQSLLTEHAGRKEIIDLRFS